MPNAQTMDALALAHEIRLRRAAERRRIYAMSGEDGRAALAELIAEMPDWLEGERLGRLVTWPRRHGREKMRRILTTVSAAGLPVGEDVRLAALTSRQRAALVLVLCGEAGPELEPIERVCRRCRRKLPVAAFFHEGDGDGATRRRTLCVVCLRAVKREEKRAEKEFSGFVSAAPFREWLVAHRPYFETWADLSSHLGISVRTVGAVVTGERGLVQTATVHNALTRYGTPVSEVYRFDQEAVGA